ncbi:MAG: PilZ domain-containing protein [Planctomycetes bacterium]|nr:PilZ domain-containing protein [Planctomycetota bacterium]
MADSNDGSRYFLVLCLAERAARYEEVFAKLPHEFSFVADTLDLLVRCMERPPLAVLIDTTSSARIGASVINPLFELQTGWPLLRCTLRPDGTVTVLCTAPDRRGTLTEALDAIAADDPGWRPPWGRRYLRGQVNCRVRMRACGEETWQPGNCLDLSTNGAFIITYHAPDVGQEMELEINDLLEEPVRVRGRVARVRRWEDGVDIPGMGVQLEMRSVPPELSRAIISVLSARALSR